MHEINADQPCEEIGEFDRMNLELDVQITADLDADGIGILRLLPAHCFDVNDAVVGCQKGSVISDHADPPHFRGGRY